MEAEWGSERARGCEQTENDKPERHTSKYLHRFSRLQQRPLELPTLFVPLPFGRTFAYPRPMLLEISQLPTERARCRNPGDGVLVIGNQWVTMILSSV